MKCQEQTKKSIQFSRDWGEIKKMKAQRKWTTIYAEVMCRIIK